MADDDPLAAARWTLVPKHMRSNLHAYIMRGAIPNRFLIAVLANDLVGAVTRGNPETLACLPRILEFLRRYAPRECYGRPEALANWEASGGLVGIRTAARTGQPGNRAYAS